MKILKKENYRWVIIVISFLMIFVCLGFCSSSKSVYLSAITEALGIKRSLFSINDSCRFVSTAIINLFFGTLISRFGTRKMIAGGFVSLIISMLIYANATSIVGFCIGGCFLGIGLAWTTTTMVGHVVNNWCHEHKGKIMGVVMAANGIGAAIATQIVTPIIYQKSNQFGYRQAYRLIAVILAVTAVVVVSLFRNKPTSAVTSTKREEKKVELWQGITFQQAKSRAYFYSAMVCVFLTGFVLHGVTGVLAAYLTDVGMEAGFMATVVSIQAVALSVAKIIAGTLHDRYGLRATVLFCDVSAIVAFIVMALITPTAGGKILAVLFAILASLALPMETIMLPLITEYMFGQRSYTQMLGIFVSVNTAGYAVGAPVVNLIYDVCGTYKPIIIVSAVIVGIVAIELQRIFAIIHKERMLEV